jgi:hypothetical protein
MAMETLGAKQSTLAATRSNLPALALLRSLRSTQTHGIQQAVLQPLRTAGETVM